MCVGSRRNEAEVGRLEVVIGRAIRGMSAIVG